MNTILAVGGAMMLVAAPKLLRAEIILPGTQPMEHGIRLDDAANCQKCHAGTREINGEADIYFAWEGGLMAQAARDPVFRAALAIANQDVAGVGEYCIRCHSPRSWLEGLSSVPNASLLTNDYLHGVSCEVCHRLVDPLSPAAAGKVKQAPPGYGNGMMVVDPERVAYGPWEFTRRVMPRHAAVKASYQATSELCANCHNVSNPLLASSVNTQPPHAYGHIERTYSEWALSDYAKPESQQTCQSCHYPRVPEGGQATRYSERQAYFVRHGPTGGSTWVQDAIYEVWKGKDLDREALDASKRRAREFLKSAAALGLEAAGRRARLVITNLTGHKLPTGYPEGRRMWVNARFLDQNSNLLGEVGRYGAKDDTLGGRPVRVPTLLDPGNTQVYHCKPGISRAQAAKYKMTPGPSFHFILNDVTTWDNRIPPRGFRRTAFAEHLAAPVGANYADGQYWHEVELALPPGTTQVEVRLMYQSVSWEYLKFLVEENRTDDWGRRLYDAWEVTGKCPPEEIASAKVRVVQ